MPPCRYVSYCSDEICSRFGDRVYVAKYYGCDTPSTSYTCSC